MYFCPYKCFASGLYPNQNKSTQAQMELRNTIRMLWEQHSAWTRMTITSIVFGLPDEEATTNRLLRNPKDFVKVLAIYYGEKNATKFSDLLTEHLVLAAQLVKAAKAGDNKSASEIENRWYKNADNLAAFWGRINPYCSYEDWKAMLFEHLALVKAEAVTLLSEDYPGSVRVYDQIKNQALEMADMMAEGIIRQFPGKFSK